MAIAVRVISSFPACASFGTSVVSRSARHRIWGGPARRPVAGSAAELLRGHVRERPCDRARAREAAVAAGRDWLLDLAFTGLRGSKHARQAEIADLGAAMRIEQDVARLDIAMHQADLVRGGETAPCFEKHLDHLPPSSRPRHKPCRERSAACQLHRDEQLARNDRRVVDPDHRCMLDPCHGACLAVQEQLRGRDVPSARIDLLERDLAYQTSVARAVHPAHAAPPRGTRSPRSDRHGCRAPADLAHQAPAPRSAPRRMPKRPRTMYRKAAAHSLDPSPRER